MTDWLPIETLPATAADETQVLMLNANGVLVAVFWAFEGGWFATLNGAFYGLPVDPPATHWMPAPARPDGEGR